MGKKYVYFMLEPNNNAKGVVSRELFPAKTNWENAYSLFYDQEYANIATKFKNVKKIHRRIW